MLEQQFAAPGSGDGRAVKDNVRRLAAQCAAFAHADARQAILQIITTVICFVAIVSLMFWTVRDAYWLTLLLALPAGGLVVRLFIIQHDCGHGSFFASQTANDAVGRCISLLTLTPFGLWKREHAQHHGTSGNLDRRGIGDITTLTVKEYQELPALLRLRYRIYRHPLFLFAFGIPCYFLIVQRMPCWHGLPARDAWQSVLALDLAIIAIYGPLAAVSGLTNLLLVAVPAIVVAAASGGWMFYIQHQFDQVYWERIGRWDFQSAAVFGSSYYALPAIFNWFTGHIGLHHIHHLASKIPNYRLQACLDAIPEFKSLNRLTPIESLECARLKLWDEDSHRLVGFADVR